MRRYWSATTFALIAAASPYDIAQAQSYGTSAGASVWIFIDGPRTDNKPLSTALVTEAEQQVTFQGTNSYTAAKADLISGTLDARATSTYSCCMSTSAGAELRDRLSFVVEGAAADTLTYVPVEFEVSGSLSAFGGAAAIAQGSLGLSQFSTVGSNVVPIPYRGFGAGYYLESGGYKQFGSNNNWASFDFSENNQSFVAKGNVVLFGSMTSFDLSINIGTIITGNATSDYSTGPFGSRVRFYLPSNVTYTSTSGASPISVPEPATWALMIAGFGAVGAATRRRRVLRAA